MAGVSGTNSTADYDDYTSFNEYKAGILIWKIVPPILIILGTAGNSLSILVLTRRSIRTSTTALYLTVLAFSDLVVLYSGLLRQWLIHLFDTDVRKVSEFGCKLNIWVVYSSLDFSAWILIVVTLERVISAWLPHNARTLCTKKSAIALLISVGIFILCLNAHLLYGMAFTYPRNDNGDLEIRKCVEINEAYYDFFNVTWPWIDFCAFCLIPFTVIVIGNALILVKVLKSQRKVKSRVGPSVANGNRHTASSGHGSKQSSMTAMLFTLNIVFLLSTSPISIYNIGYPTWTENATQYDYAHLDLWWAIVNMLMYVNNSLNFLLYCLSGTKFRLEVIRIFCSWRHRNGAGNTRMAPQSNYTRTRFDTPSPSPSARNSAVFTVDTKSYTDTNNGQNVSTNKNGTTTFRHSSNSLHPKDALKIASSMAANTGNDVQKKDLQTESLETSDSFLLGNLGSERIASGHIIDTESNKTSDIKSNDFENDLNDVLDNQIIDVNDPNGNTETNLNTFKEMPKPEVEIVTCQADENAAGEKNSSTSAESIKGNIDREAKDSTV